MELNPLSNTSGLQLRNRNNLRSVLTSLTHSGSKRHNQRYVTHGSVFGGQFSPSANPPDVIFQPWYRVTLVEPFTTILTLTLTRISDRIKSQLDPTRRGFNQISTSDARFIIQMKLKSIQAWNLTGRMIHLSVDDYTDTRSSTGGRDQIINIVDTGSPTLLPKLGFKLPASHSNHVLRSDQSTGALMVPPPSQLVIKTTFAKILATPNRI